MPSARSRTDLPAPFGPTITVAWPGSTRTETPCSTCLPPSTLVNPVPASIRPSALRPVAPVAPPQDYGACMERDTDDEKENGHGGVDGDGLVLLRVDALCDA